jgi:hypothetical protein
MPARDQVAVPAQHRVRAHQNRSRRSTSGAKRYSTAARKAREPDLPPAQLAFQHRDLMP